MIRRLLFGAILGLLLTISAWPQAAFDASRFSIYDGQGTRSTIEQLVNVIGENEAIFLGEQHNDAVAHAIQAEIFRRVVERYGPQRRVGLSLEMFERDVQIVLAEYLGGLITENHFLLSSRPWPNYKTDYRPLVELAREKKLPVIAANAPRRYINMVSRNGRSALNGLDKNARNWLPRLPYAEPSAAYSTKFKALMGSAPEARAGIDNILASQALWDAAMADAVAGFLKKNKKGLVVHLNGSFHTEGRLGTVEHLLKYRPKTKALVVTMMPESNFSTFDPAKHRGLGDFVILTAPATRAVLPEVLKRMDQHRAALKTLRAQTTVIEQNSQIATSDVSTGHVSMLMPDGGRKQYFRYDSNTKKETVVAIGDSYQMYKPAINQLYHGKLSTTKMAGGIRLLDFLAMTTQDLQSNFDVLYRGGAQVGETKAWHIEVKGKFGGDPRSADIWIDSDGMPIKMTEKRQDGSSSSMTLFQIVKNAPLELSVFRLVTPANAKRIQA